MLSAKWIRVVTAPGALDSYGAVTGFPRQRSIQVGQVFTLNRGEL
jgi:hypothetical protein